MITSKKARHAAPAGKMSSFKKITAVAVFGAMVAFSAISASSDGKTAYITDGDNSFTIAADGSTVENILSEAGITLYSGDETIVTEQSGNTLSITIKRAFPVTVNAFGGTSIVRISSGTVADALRSAGIKTSAADFITPSPSTKLTEGMEITVQKGVKVYLVKAGEQTLTYVPEGTVKDSLEYIGCELCSEGSGDIKDTDMVESGMTLCVDEVFYKTSFAVKTIQPKTIEEKTSELKAGEKKIKIQGKEGTAEVAYKEKYINGELVEKKEDKSTVKTKPVDTVMLVGTAQDSEEDAAEPETTVDEKENTSAESDSDTDSQEVSHSGNDFSYKSVITGSCTAYYEPNGITAIGTIPTVGTVAVDPSIIPYGTKLYIASEDGSYVYGYAIAEDTGGAAMAGDIVADLYMNSEAECCEFGRRVLNIYILD